MTSYNEIISSELSKLLRQEIAGSLQGIFMRSPMSAGNGNMALNVIINNNAGVSVTAREGVGAMDQKYLEITIDQMVANSLMRGRQTSGVMRTLFGLAPSLMGR